MEVSSTHFLTSGIDEAMETQRILSSRTGIYSLSALTHLAGPEEEVGCLEGNCFQYPGRGHKMNDTMIPFNFPAVLTKFN
jgi:hypothetical protein